METFDLQQTHALEALLGTPRDQRDETWRDKFFAAVPNASLTSFDQQIETGPDGFPYFQLALPEPGAFTPFSIVHILSDVLQKGAGVVIYANPRRTEGPVWVFTLGDMLSYSLFQDFLGDPEIYKTPQPPADPSDRTLLRGSPSDAYLPPGVRAAMGRFLRGPIQLADPRIGLVSGASLRPRDSLMVNLRASDYGGDPNQLNAAMNYLTWFVPGTYSVMALPEDWSDAGMLPLP